MADCELCRLARGLGDTEFERRYGTEVSRTTRLVPGLDGVLAMPSVGSLGSLHALVLPTRHLRSSASATEELRRSLWRCVRALRAALSDAGSGTIVLEHGLPFITGRGCGVEHAHVHVVEVPLEHDFEVPPGDWESQQDTAEHPAIDPRREHLVIGLPSGTWLVRYEEDVESQLLRRWLAGELGQEQWDWRAAGSDENLPRQARRLRTLLGVESVAVSA
jgi:diadenosine tetraphosphate (Ap4A) HIT family hydrolase